MNYQEFILEVNKHREEKLNYQYGERNKPENYLPKDSLLDLMKQKKGLKTAQGNALTPQVAQLAPLEKENQLPYKYSKYGIRTVEPSMGNLKDRVKRYGNLQRLKDIDPRYP
jgi:hypothetical protein